MIRPSARQGRGASPAAFKALVAALLAAGLATAAAAQSPPTTPDGFLAAAAGSDQYEIMAGRLILVESRDPAVRALATEIIRDHEAATAALQQAAARSGLKPASSNVGGDEVQLLAALQGAPRPDINQLYLRQQVLAHQQALTTLRGYLRDGSDPNLRAAAQSDLPMIEQNRLEAQGLSK